MVIDEQELRQRLRAAANRAAAPRFTADAMTGRIRRRRAQVTGLVSGLLLTVTGVAVAVPLALSGRTAPGEEARPGFAPFQLTFSVAVNGRREFPHHGAPPSFTVRPGEKLVMDVDITVPGHAAASALWLGITSNVLAPRRHGPADMTPILLARPHERFGSGTHAFRLRWDVPASLRPGTGRQLSMEWAWTQPPPGVAERIVAELVTRTS